MVDEKVVTTIVKAPKRWTACEPTYDIDKHLMMFLSDSPFYCEISRHVAKRFSLDLPTAGVTYDIEEDQVVLYLNPVFLGGGTYTDKNGDEITEEPKTASEIRGLLTHEFDHLVYGHLNVRRRNPHDDWNKGTDLAINSLIKKRTKQPQNIKPGQEWRCLPSGGLIPGERPYIDPIRFAKLDPASQAATLLLCDLIEKLPPEECSEWYFKKLREFAHENHLDGKQYVIIGGDDHDGWDDVPDEMREYVESKIKGIIEGAVNRADSSSWGDIPSELRQEIRRSVSRIVDWRSVLKQFVGSTLRGMRTSSIKRINRRYPYIHPGTKRGYIAKLFVAVDESGSVDDGMLVTFFGELDTLTRKTSITLCHFDCHTGPKDLYEWKKGMRPKLQRVRGGGTDFSAPTRVVNDPKNRGRWDGIIILTDGQAPKPISSRVKRAWVLGKDCKLAFDTNETQVHMTNERSLKGAWR